MASRRWAGLLVVVAVVLAVALGLRVRRAEAGPISLRLSVEPRTLGVGQVGELTLEIQGARLSEHPSIPAEQGLRVSPTTQSQSFSVGRGNVAATAVFGYQLTALAPGEYRLGPVEVRNGAQVLRSNDVKIVVLAGRGAERAGNADGANTSKPEVPEDPWFARASISDNDLVVGQSVLYRLEIGWATQVGNVSPEFPDWGLLSPEGGVGNQQEQRREVLDGRAFEIVTVTVPLFALQAGQAELPPTKVTLEVRRSRGFLAAGEPVTVSTAALPIRVHDPPAEGRPAAFSGAVGRFAMRASLDPATVAAGETATRTVIIEGPGSLHGAKLMFTPPPGVRIYEETPDVQAVVTGGELMGRATFRQAIVPTAPGVLEIPAATFHWFDAESGRYGEASTGPGRLTVTGEALVAPTMGAGVKKEGVVSLGEDILPPHPATLLRGDARRSAGSPLVLALLVLPPLGFCGGAAWRWHARSAGTDAGRERQSRKDARAALEEAGAAAEEGNWAGTELALRRWFSARLSVKGAAMTPDEVEALLVARDLPAEGAHGRRLLSQVEAVRYGGAQAGDLAEALMRWADDVDGGLG